MTDNMRVSRFGGFAVALVLMFSTASTHTASAQQEERDLWKLAQANASLLRFSTLFTAQNVRDYLSTPEGINDAIQWCKETAVTHVYLETFRDGYTADRAALLNAKKRFAETGFLVSGCVTTTKIGRESVNGWMFPCFTEQAGLDNLERVFEFTASLFDEIMVDDFYATGCECEDCKQACGERSWSEFRCEMLVDVSRRYVLEPARKVNPDVVTIIKYPQWYDGFHERGYDVARETKMFDKIWVGTETRDPDNKEWGSKTQYEAYFIMRWLGEIGGSKCGGGWFDPYGTSPPTYLEQARQTVLAGAEEAVLFCYGSLIRDTGPGNIQALRKELPSLFRLAQIIQGKTVRGISAPKPPNSDAGEDRYIYDFIGMLGLPLVPTATIRDGLAAAFLPHQTLKDPQIASKIAKMTDAGASLLITNHLSEALSQPFGEESAHVQILDIPDDPWDLMDIPTETLQEIRKKMLAPFGLSLDAPTRVAMYCFDSDLVILENFNDRSIQASLRLETKARPSLVLELSTSPVSLEAAPGLARFELPARSLAAVRFGRE